MWLQQSSRTQIRGPAQAAQRARPATTELYPSLNTVFSVSFPQLHRLYSRSLQVQHNCCDCCYPLRLENHDHTPSIECIVVFPLLFSVDILLNRSQQLFASCTAKFADGQQCSIPVFDITHQTPLCEEHAKKMVSSMFNVLFIDRLHCFDFTQDYGIVTQDSKLSRTLHTG